MSGLAWQFWPRVSQEEVVRCQLKWAQVGLEDLLRQLTHVAGELEQDFHSSCGPLHWTAWVFSRTWQLAPPRASSSKERRSQAEATSLSRSGFGSHSIPSATFHSLETSYQVWSRFTGKELLRIFTGGVSKNLWTYLKLPRLVGCRATDKPSSPERKVLLDPVWMCPGPAHRVRELNLSTQASSYLSSGYYSNFLFTQGCVSFPTFCLFSYFLLRSEKGNCDCWLSLLYFTSGQ